jgi:hypothetical protein
MMKKLLSHVKKALIQPFIMALCTIFKRKKKQKTYLMFIYNANKKVVTMLEHVLENQNDVRSFFQSKQHFICRFKTTKTAEEINAAVRTHSPSILYFLVELNKQTMLTYKLYDYMANNLMTDNPEKTPSVGELLEHAQEAIKDNIEVFDDLITKEMEKLDKDPQYLKECIKDALESENYEVAAKLRDKLKNIEEEITKENNKNVNDKSE